jgi:hypothetical protein
LKKKEGSVDSGIDYEHQKAKDYLTQQHRNSEPEEEALTQLVETPINSNHQSTVSKS